MLVVLLVACEPSLEIFPAEPVFDVMGTAEDGLAVPRDLGFEPGDAGRLWTVNRENDGTVIYTVDLEGEEPAIVDAELRIDKYANHFMEEVSSIAFGELENFATCQESRNRYDGEAPANDFMGPALWPSDLDVYGKAGTGFNKLGSHIDMLHGSPFCMGVAHDAENAFFVFDGFNGELVWYDFQHDHGPGNDDHSDGLIRRWSEVALTRVAGVPGHMELDRESGMLFVANTGEGEVLRVDTASGEVVEDLPETNEPLGEHSRIGGTDFEVFAGGLQEPSGLAVADGLIYVGDHATGRVHAFDVDGVELAVLETPAEALMGLEIGPDGRLWYVDAEREELVVVW